MNKRALKYLLIHHALKQLAAVDWATRHQMKYRFYMAQDPTQNSRGKMHLLSKFEPVSEQVMSLSISRKIHIFNEHTYAHNAASYPALHRHNKTKA